MFITTIARILNRPYLLSPDDLEAGISGDLDVLNNDKDDKNDDKSDDDKDDKSDDKDDDDKADGNEDKDKDDDADKGDEEDTEDEDEDKDEDDEDEKEEDNLPSVKDIKKEFPDFFKKHPEVKAAIFRDQRFSEILGTPEEAEQAVERSNTLAAVEKDLFIDSNPGKLLDALKKNNEVSYHNTVFNILTHLQEHDKETYYELSALPIKQLLRNAWREGNGDETNLGKAAAYIHQFMFGKGSKLEDAVKAEGVKKSDKSQAQKDYEERLSKLDQKEYDNFKGAVDQSYMSKMDRFIRETLDKDERLTEWTRKNIVNETLSEIVKQLENDTRHNTVMGSLWKNAKTSGFNNDFKSRIITTALARAKSLAPSIRAKLVNEALGKVGKKDKKDSKDQKDDKDTKRESRKDDKRDDKRSSRSSSNRDNKKPLTDIDILRG